MMKMLKIVFTSVLLCFLFICSYSQFANANTSYSEIEKLDKNKAIDYDKKLALFYQIKKIKEKQALQKDSSYILLLLEIAKYEQYINNNYNLAFQYTTQAIEFNKTIHSASLAFISNYNLALFYDNQFAYTKALSYCDSTILHCKLYNYSSFYETNAHWIKANIYLNIGDYQKTVDESNFGLAVTSIKKDTVGYVYFLNRKASALFYENDLPQSLKIAETAIAYNIQMDLFELSMSYKTIAKIYENKKLFDSALFFYTKAINSSISLKNNSLVADNYIDLGNFYLDAMHDYIKANEYYYKTINWANKINDNKNASLTRSTAFTNLCETSLRQQHLDDAEKFIQSAFLNVDIDSKSILNPISSNQFNTITNKDLVTYLLFNKTNLLLQKFKNTKQNIYLQSCLHTALLTDSVNTQIRHEQLGEKSKLFWRDKTRNFYTNAIEASYLASNAGMCFYFMEKSRAVLLNDKLNELGANAHLPAAETKKQENFSIKIVDLEQKLLTLKDSLVNYRKTQMQLLNVKNDYEQYIKSLELNYPEYYQYKYDDKVVSLQTLQQYLSKHNQSFVEYFFDDSTTFFLAVTPNNTKLIKLSANQLNKNDLITFLNFCSSKEKLNNNYPAFASLSNSIYKKLFQPLNFKSESVIICTDNIVIPFEALCTNTTGKNFLINNYSFSYVYSARYLIKQFNNAKPKGNFIGFAPVSFASNLQVADLKNAAAALNSSADYYSFHKLFTNTNASRKNFFNYACSYSVVSIFSHAKADTTDNEPVLFMQDSLIHLSELQLMNNPATKLVLLSACQTNVGRNATGEGIYSLARGFATAGISSVSATLWKADEQTIYTISEKFNQYLSQGFKKDEALQKAKLYFLQHNSSNEKLLPYYWANMILIGNTDAIQFTSEKNNYWWLIAVAVIIITATLFVYFKKKKRK